MVRNASIPLRILLTFTFLAGFISSAAAVAGIQLSESYGKLPLHFEGNQGQAHKDVRFLARGPGYSLYLTGGEAVLVLARPDPQAKLDGRRTPGRRAAPAQTLPVTVKMGLVGAAPAPLVGGLEELPGKANYFIGNDPGKWRTNVPTYAKVRYREVYPGIDLVYYGNQRQLEYDFVVAPGADPKKIVLGFKGADKIEIDANGDLVLHAAGGTIRQHKPIIYQEIDGVRHEISGSYVRRGANRVGFKVAAYDASHPLVIDPVLSYSTYLGGSGGDGASKIAVDMDGNAYVTGGTNSGNFPTTSGAYHSAIASGNDVFVTKIDPSGSRLVYSTYLGGIGNESGNGIAVDALGNAYVAGGTNSLNFPTTSGAVQPIASGSVDAFVAKLNPTGSGLIYSTYLGGDKYDDASGISVDADGSAYVSGQTDSINFPTTPGAFQTTFGGGFDGLCGCVGSDAFVVKLDPTGTALAYSTYLGGTGRDYGFAIAVDGGGNAYVTGGTTGDFPVTLGAFQTTAGGAFVAKLNPTGSSLVYSTYLGTGNADNENGRGIAVDADGNAYVAGYTASNFFPTTPGAYQPIKPAFARDDRYDVFVTKLNFIGSALVYSTYLGGSGNDIGMGIAIDSLGNAHVTGYSYSSNFPTTPDAVQPDFVGAFDPSRGIDLPDAFVTTLNFTGSVLVYSTYLGGSSDDFGQGIAVDSLRNIYVTGGTASADFPTTPGALQPVFGGGSDAFVAKLGGEGTASPPTRSEENAATYMGYWPTYGAETGTFSGGTIVASNQAAATATFSFTGTAVSWIGARCTVCGIATVQIDGGAPTTVNTSGPGVPGSLTSEVVYSASGLAPGVTHTLVITVTGAQTGVPEWPTGNGHIVVDAFEVSN